MKIRLPAGILGSILLLGLSAPRASSAQVQGAGPAISDKEAAKPEHFTVPDVDPATGKAKISASAAQELLRRFGFDQKEIWMSPTKIRLSDAGWILPLAGVSATLFATDASFHRSQMNASASIARYKTVSTAGVGALAAAAGGMWLLSWSRHNGHNEQNEQYEHERDTGLIAGEAALSSLAMVEALKYSFRRERPLEGDGSGPFFKRGGTSFASEHAAAAWSIAGVIAHEYPGPFTKIAAYGLATLVSLSRVRASQHFPSDVLIGSLAGYMISQDIYSRHPPADEEGGGTDWRSFSEMFRIGEDTPTGSMGSTYVPLDSWVYPAMERLEALGYIHSAFEGTKPWSRTECARLISEANDELSQAVDEDVSAASTQAQQLLAVLSKEFHRQADLQAGDANNSAALPTVYTRVTSASGAVLSDGYHFGQTYAYDYGRPFRRGTNFVSGFSAEFTSGRVFLHLGGEFQHAPHAPALSDEVREVIAERDLVALRPAQAFDAIDHFAIMDSYVGVNLNGWQISFGKQSLEWGPGPGGSLILSDNADPFYMVRLTQSHPAELPSFLGLLGPVHTETFAGREEGHPLSGHPFIFGQKISVKPLKSLEFAYARTTTLAGMGDPLNTRTFFESLFGRVDSREVSAPGDSHTSLDWTWHVPHLHERFIFYGELESDDDPIPLQNLSRAMVRPGIYLARLPWLSKWDLHAEWTSSECPGQSAATSGGRLNYWNGKYRDGYTNNGNLVGNTVGREGKTMQAWTRFWISPRQTMEFTVKNSTVDSRFVPGGGRWQDYRVTYEAAFGSKFFLRSFLQFEHITKFPLLFSGARSNLTLSIEIGFSPRPGH